MILISSTISTVINNGSKDFHRTTPRAGLTYLVTPGASVYFNYGQGFRVPTYNELFGSGLGPFGSGNPNLRPVRSDNFEVGARSRIQTWGEASLALFRADVRDEIFLACGDPTLCPGTTNQNIPESRRQGIETTFKARFNQYFDGVVNYTYTQATFQSDLVLNPYFVGFNPFLENVKKGRQYPSRSEESVERDGELSSCIWLDCLVDRTLCEFAVLPGRRRERATAHSWLLHAQ